MNHIRISGTETSSVIFRLTGGGGMGCDCYAQLGKHHDYVVVAVFGKFSFSLEGGGSKNMWSKMSGQVFTFHFMLGGSISKHSWSGIL